MNYENRVSQNNPFDAVLTGCKTSRRTRLSDIVRKNAYNDIINTIGWSRYEYKGLPDDVTLTSEEIERAVCCGAGVIYRVPEKLGSASSGMIVCTPVEWVGVKKADNTSDNFITYLPRGDYSATKDMIEVESGALKDGYVIIRNNFEMTSDYDFTEWTADMLNETDISEMQLIKWSRMTPVAKAISNANAEQLSQILRRVYNGEPWAVISDATKVMTGTASSRDDMVLRLTDETAIERMHFLSEFHYELIRRLCNLYNIPFHTTAKSAQNLESELHNTDIFSRMLTENGLKWRKKSEKALSEFFGTPITVELGAMFKKENEVIENVIDSTAPDTFENTQNEQESPSESVDNKVPKESEGA